VRGFRSCSFDCRTGSQSHHGLRFPKPPYNPGRPDFPGPVWNLGFLPKAFPSLERFKRWSVYTPAILVCLQPRLLSCRGVTPVLSSRPPYGQVSRQVSWAPLPNFGATSVGEMWVPSPPRALPLRHRSYGLMCHSRWALSCFGI